MSDALDQWYYLDGGIAQGPVPEEELRGMLAAGSLATDALVARVGESAWTAAETALPDAAAGPASPGPPPPPPSPAPAPAVAGTAILLRCTAGPRAGTELWVGRQELALDEQLAESDRTFVSWREGELHVRCPSHRDVLVAGRAHDRVALAQGRTFELDGSTWKVGEAPVGVMDLVQRLGDRLNRLASIDKLEGFSLREMFSEVFKRRTPDEIEQYFLVGTSTTTPPIEDVETGWPKPWFFLRVLLFIAVVFLVFTVSVRQFGNARLIPGLLMMGSLAVPFAAVILFFELNTPRNVSFHRVLILFSLGGVVSLFVSLLGFGIGGLSWLGASSAGIVEEIGKLIAVMLVAREARYRYISNGLLVGAAVGAGFAVFESAGYAFDALRSLQMVQQRGSSFDIVLTMDGVNAMIDNIQLRAVLSPFAHVAWTAIAAAALWRVKGERPPALAMLVDPSFAKTFLIPVVLHMLWNSPIPNPFYLKYLVLGTVGWFIVFGLVQQGLRQVLAEQKQVAEDQLRQTQLTTGSIPLPSAVVPADE